MTDMEVYKQLSSFAESLGLTIIEDIPFDGIDALILNDFIGMGDKLTEQQKPFILGHEIAHHILHHGNLTQHPSKQAERDADNVGNVLVQLIKYMNADRI